MTNDAERVSDIVARLRGANSDRITPIDALRLHDENPGTFPLSPEDVEGVLDLVDEAADIIEAQSKALAEARVAGAIVEIAAERQRQKSVEGWTPEHDDEHADGQLAAAAASYAYPAGPELGDKTVPHHWSDDSRYMDDQSEPVGDVIVPVLWPWDGQWWKPKDRRRNLVKAAALIVAEIERLDRLTPTPENPMADQTNAEVSDERLRELLPCPFCGAENRVHVGFIGNTEFYLTCGKCGAHGPLMLQMTGNTIDLERAWNRRSVTSQASEGEVGARKKSMTLDLTDAEIETLEALAKKQELSPARVLIQGLRHYQLLVEGAPDLGPMLPPGFVIAPEWPIGDAYVTWYDPQEIPKPGKLIDCSLAVMDHAEVGDRFYSEKQVHEIVSLYASPVSKRVERLETALKPFADAAADLPEHIHDMVPVVLTTDAEDNPADIVHIGDFRRASQALQGGRS